MEGVPCWLGAEGAGESSGMTGGRASGDDYGYVSRLVGDKLAVRFDVGEGWVGP